MEREVIHRFTEDPSSTEIYYHLRSRYIKKQANGSEKITSDGYNFIQEVVNSKNTSLVGGLVVGLDLALKVFYVLEKEGTEAAIKFAWSYNED